MQTISKFFGGVAIVAFVLVCRLQGEGPWYWIGYVLFAALMYFAFWETISRIESES